jgi:hypothetical protein
VALKWVRMLSSRKRTQPFHGSGNAERTHGHTRVEEDIDNLVKGVFGCTSHLSYKQNRVITCEKGSEGETEAWASK